MKVFFGLIAILAAAALSACSSAMPPSPVASSMSEVVWTGHAPSTQDGPMFTVPSWASGVKVHWSFACTDPQGGFFDFLMDGPNGYVGSGPAISGHHHQGTDYYYATGPMQAKVSSGCPWTITATAIP